MTRLPRFSRKDLLDFDIEKFLEIPEEVLEEIENDVLSYDSDCREIRDAQGSRVLRFE